MIYDLRIVRSVEQLMDDSAKSGEHFPGVYLLNPDDGVTAVQYDLDGTATWSEDYRVDEDDPNSVKCRVVAVARKVMDVFFFPDGIRLYCLVRPEDNVEDLGKQEIWELRNPRALTPEQLTWLE